LMETLIQIHDRVGTNTMLAMTEGAGAFPCVSGRS
jgi:hypothetical protein